jgi:hypothetical protein
MKTETTKDEATTQQPAKGEQNPQATNDQLPKDSSVKSETANPLNSPQKPTKHYLDWILAVFAFLSLLLNIYLFFQKQREVKIAQSPPNIFRTIMPIGDGRIFYGLRERKDLLIQRFPSPAWVSTPEWNEALSAADNAMTENQLQRSLWRFLTLQSPGNLTYKGIELKILDKTIASISSLGPQQTIFLYYENESSIENLQISYIIQGDSSINTTNIPPKSPNEIAVITELSGIKIASLQGIDDRTKQLLNSKNTSLPFDF